MEMAYCAEHAIPHSVFLDTWSAEDRAKLMAQLMEKSERCTMCGTASWEWTEDPFAYEPVLETCLGCQKKELKREAQQKEEAVAGASVVLLPRAVAARLRAAAEQMKSGRRRGGADRP